MNNEFLIKSFSQKQIQQELHSIDFDEMYLNIAKDKYDAMLLKIYSLTPIQATILKQTAILFDFLWLYSHDFTKSSVFCPNYACFVLFWWSLAVILIIWTIILHIYCIGTYQMNNSSSPAPLQIKTPLLKQGRNHTYIIRWCRAARPRCGLSWWLR